MQEPEHPEHAPTHECLDWCPICRGAEVLKATASPELIEQLQQAQRGALVSMRALIDAYLERIDAERAGEPADGARAGGAAADGGPPPSESTPSEPAADRPSSG